jgi:ferrochelatase
LSATSRTGVLLVNLGTPDRPTPRAVRRYLAEFLSDPRVVDLPPWLWQPILHGLVLRTRPRRSAALYRSIWTEEGSPLLVYTMRLAQALARSFGPDPDAPVVAYAMRYGRPDVRGVVRELVGRHAVGRLAVLPLYPQYAASSSASAFDALASSLRHETRIPHLEWIAHYHDRPAYIDALSAHVRERRGETASDRHLLFSFHGLPRRSHEEGDPYYTQCLETAERLAVALDLRPGSWSLAFQSRFGPAAWLPPYTIEEVRRLARAGVRRLDVACPGFACDCLETLEEIARTNAEAFLEAGGEDFRYLPALNDDARHVALLREILDPVLDVRAPHRSLERRGRR